jgi:hypothetical protein
MSESTRPKRVVIVDADNPLQEISGEFFWREDHDRIVAEAREAAYKGGFERGFESGRRSAPATILVRRRRGRSLARFLIMTVLLVALIAYVADVLLPVLGSFV